MAGMAIQDSGVATVDKKGCISCSLCTSLPEHMHDCCGIATDSLRDTIRTVSKEIII